MTSLGRMDTTGDVRAAIQTTLEQSGALKEVKAKLRAEVFRSLDDSQVPLPQQPREVALASEVVADFLKALSFDNTNEVFSQESSHGSQNPLGRAYIAQELGLRLVQDDGRVPLLCLIIEYLEARKKDATQKFGADT